ncbi:LysE family translocator [Pseudoroseicyclus aestuarii]|uniref:Threonine/homoserine/homoserine lactone efflux protein n=1 Tax=Pseudoroseicyclus aestuarii TaxID=1795041 RepID=A0A318SQB0_9RHOB|nr:LysE family translocator [Pseudoroseicyclus aestuarii]PYE82538.1 threonine/homoserine/homoserine lactone efflux protein [Pseudoroseicyclus aestuarii]
MTSLIPALAGFAVVALFTPGPNNLMLMASGATFGFRRTLPHMAGIVLGFSLMIALVGLGLAGLFAALPWLTLVLKALAILFLGWMAYRIATAAPREPGEAAPDRHPLSLLQAAAFQWVNPKAWALALTATTVYLPQRDLAGILLASGVFFGVGLFSTTTWAALGEAMGRLLTDPRRARAFNIAMALLLIATLWPILRH